MVWVGLREKCILVIYSKDTCVCVCVVCVLHRTYQTWIPAREERCWKQPGHSWIFWASLGESARASHSPCAPFGGFWTLSGKTVPLRRSRRAHWNMQRCGFLPTRGTLGPESCRARESSLQLAGAVLFGLQVINEKRNWMVWSLSYQFGHQLLQQESKAESSSMKRTHGRWERVWWRARAANHTWLNSNNNSHV